MGWHLWVAVSVQSLYHSSPLPPPTNPTNPTASRPCCHSRLGQTKTASLVSVSSNWPTVRRDGVKGSRGVVPSLHGALNFSTAVPRGPKSHHSFASVPRWQPLVSIIFPFTRLLPPPASDKLLRGSWRESPAPTPPPRVTLPPLFLHRRPPTLRQPSSGCPDKWRRYASACMSIH